MAKIKWTKQQQQRLSKNVSRFNAKLTRTLKANPALAPYLPKRLDAKELRSTIKTAKDLTQLVQSIDRAFKPNAFEPINNAEGVTTTQYELNEMKIKVRRINRQRKRELEELQLSPAKGTMGMVSANNLKPKKFNFEKITPNEWDKFVASAELQAMDSYKESKWELYKENYLQACAQELGIWGTSIYDLVYEMPADAVAAAMDNYYLTIPFLYSKYDKGAKAEIILSEWQRHYSKWKKANKESAKSWNKHRNKQKKEEDPADKWRKFNKEIEEE